MEWCGSDAPVLTYPDKIVIVGPKDYKTKEFGSAAKGVKTMTEVDGLRLITSEKTYFLQRVTNETVYTFKEGSVKPSAKLIQA